MSNGDEHEIVDAPDGWRIAIKEFDDAGITYGDDLPKGWLYKAFGLEQPKPQTSDKAAQEMRVKYMACLDQFKTYLLRERSMALQTIWGSGYRIVTPEEQTSWAETEMDREMKKTFSKAAERLVNIDHSRLTSEQTKENAEALARVGASRALLLGNKRLTADTIRRLTDETE